MVVLKRSWFTLELFVLSVLVAAKERCAVTAVAVLYVVSLEL